MLARQINNSIFAANTLFRQQHNHHQQWQGPQETIAFHPSDIVAVMLRQPSLESDCNTYQNLIDHLSGAGYGSSVTQAMSSRSGMSDDHLQKRYNFHYRIALALKFPKLFEYAKLYHSEQKSLSKSILQGAQIAAHHLLIDDQLPKPNDNTLSQIEHSSQEVMHEAIDERLHKQLESMFGKKLEIGCFGDDEIFNINLRANQMINHDIDILQFDPKPASSFQRPEL